MKAFGPAKNTLMKGRRKHRRPKHSKAGEIFNVFLCIESPFLDETRLKM
jgi:hypothetical protein